MTPKTNTGGTKPPGPGVDFVAATLAGNINSFETVGEIVETLAQVCLRKECKRSLEPRELCDSVPVWRK